jgi:hypothetical protein
MAKQSPRRAPARKPARAQAPAKRQPAQPAQRRAPAQPAQRRAPAPAQPAQQFDNEMRGAMFPNNRKQYENQPDYTGQCQIDGVEYWVSGWARKSKAGQKFMSIAFTAKDEVPAAEYDNEPQYAEDDLPF